MRGTVWIFMLSSFMTAGVGAYTQQQSMPIASLWYDIPKPNRLVKFVYPWIPQTLLSYYLQYYVKKMKRLFLADVRRYATDNTYVPNKVPETLRIMNFNVRMWTTINDTPNFDEVSALVKQLDPDILILQEVTNWDATYQHYTRQLGYDEKAASCITKDPSFGVAIFAKRCSVVQTHAVRFEHQYKPQRELCFVRLDVVVHGIKLAIYGTHLEVDQQATILEDVRALQLQEILADVHTADTASAIIAGDFNSVRSQDYNYTVNGYNGWTLLKDFAHLILKFNQVFHPRVLDLCAHHNFHTSFEALQWTNPHFTNWTGRAVDFIFLSDQWALPVRGSYVYYTDVSDHLPLIVDVGLDTPAA